MNKLEKIINELNVNGYSVNNDDIRDLERQLKRKGLIIYIKSISFLKANCVEVNYDNVKNLIKLNKKFSNVLWTIVSALEENIRSIYINKKDEDILWEEYIKLGKKERFEKVIIKVSDESTKKIMDEIRWLRNQCAHLNYFILNEQVRKVIDILSSAKKLEFVDGNVIDICIFKLKECNKYNFDFYNKFFE